MAISEQENTSNCGIYVMAFVYHLAFNMEIQFTQADIPYFRLKIVVDLYNYQL